MISDLANSTVHCLIPNNQVEHAQNLVLGIGFNEFDTNIGSATDLIHVQINTENSDWPREEAERLEHKFGYFRGQPLRRIHVEEFPSVSGRQQE